MLRKISHIFFSFMLLIATTGMAVSQHYCGEYLVSTSLFGNADPCCNSGECCHNESSFFQLDEDFSTPQISKIPMFNQLSVFENFSFNTNWKLPKITVNKALRLFGHLPTLPTLKALSIIQVFRL
jgi:hypothetical protein